MQFLLVDILLELPVAAQQLPHDDEHQDRDHERDQAGRAGQEHRLRSSSRRAPAAMVVLAPTTSG